MENLFTVDCEELDDLLAVLEEGKSGGKLIVQASGELIPTRSRCRYEESRRWLACDE